MLRFIRSWLLFTALVFPFCVHAEEQKRPYVMSRDGVPYAKVTGDFDLPPRQRALAVPSYPKKLARERIVGAAIVRYRVEKSGRTKDSVVVSASRDEFGAAALEASKRSVYWPAEKSGNPVECEIELLYRFGQPGAYP